MRRVIVMVIVALAVGCGQAADDKQQPQSCPDIMCAWEAGHDVDASEVGCREPAESDDMDYSSDYCGQFEGGGHRLNCMQHAFCDDGCGRKFGAPDAREDFCQGFNR